MKYRLLVLLLGIVAFAAEPPNISAQRPGFPFDRDPFERPMAPRLPGFPDIRDPFDRGGFGRGRLGDPFGRGRMGGFGGLGLEDRWECSGCKGIVEGGWGPPDQCPHCKMQMMNGRGGFTNMPLAKPVGGAFDPKPEVVTPPVDPAAMPLFPPPVVFAPPPPPAPQLNINVGKAIGLMIVAAGLLASVALFAFWLFRRQANATVSGRTTRRRLVSEDYEVEREPERRSIYRPRDGGGPYD